MKKTIVASVALLGLAACDDPNASFPTFFQEAGAVADAHGDFGSATANNIGIQNGDRSFTISLAKRFNDEVPSTVNFAFNSTVLDDDARAILRQQAHWIAQFPEVRFKVFGYTDAVGTQAYNKRLGLRRAQTVVAYLVSQGINRSRLEAVVSFGETRPLIDTQSRERKNRRALTEVTGFVNAHPNILDGQYAAVIYREYIASAVPIPTAAVPTIAKSE